MTTPIGFGTSIVLITVGAILKYAVNASISGLELDTIGTILLIVGILGLVLSLVFLLTLTRSRRDPYAGDVPPRGEYVRETREYPRDRR